MKNILSIMSREFNYYFLTPLGYIVLTCFLLLNGIIFYILVDVLNSPMAKHGAVMELFFGGTLFFWLYLLTFIPVITMKLLSEEHHNGTIESLMTLPVKETEIILGKYLGAMFFYIFLWVPTLLYVGILFHYSEPAVGPILSSYLGVILVGALFVAIGLLVSSVTKSQVVSAIITFAVLVLLFLTGLLANYFTNPLYKDIISYVNLFDIMDNFSKGIINSKNLVYLISTSLGILFINIKVIRARKWVN